MYFDNSQQDKPRNYKLEKKLRNTDLDDQIDLISSFRNDRNILLPIDNVFRELVHTIEKSNVTIVMGETGCGKSTKIPEFLYKCSNQNYRIAHILPRKIATITIAQKVCKNMGLTIGKEVGYSVRFDYNYSEETRVKFLTEGMFIREMLIDPLLTNYNVIIIDDCHERTINSEIIFGLLKKIFVKRKELKIIVSSATLDYQSYLKFFPKEENFVSNIFVVTGRTYPVDIYYVEQPVKNYIESAVISANNIHKNYPKSSGDILVFLTGQEDINLFIEYANNYGLDRGDVVILPLLAGLPVERQLEVFAPTPYNKRKIVVSTNIAEASVTIENIGFVVDSCLVKMKFYNSKIDADALYIIPASQFSLDQRAGRAGRTKPGQCFRLITQDAFDRLYLMTNPELLRSNLLEFILRIKSMGIKDLSKFETLTEPDRNTIARSLENLFFLGIIDDQTNLTELGLKVCDLPIDPKLGVALFKSGEVKFKCVEEVLIIVSMLSIQNLFFQPRDPTNLLKAKQRVGIIQGDHLTLHNIFKQWKNCKTSRSKFCKDIYLNENGMKQADEMIKNLKPYLKKYDIPIKSSLDDDGEDVSKAFLKGFFLNVAQKQYDGSYRSLRWNIPIYIHPTSVLYTIMPEYVLYNEITVTAKNYVKDVLTIDKKWIMEVASNYYEDKTNKLIQTKHHTEVKSYLIQSTNLNSTNHLANKIPDKNNIIKLIEKNEEKFKMRNTEQQINFRNNSNRLFMEVEKNKDYNCYFEENEEEFLSNKINFTRKEQEKDKNSTKFNEPTKDSSSDILIERPNILSTSTVNFKKIDRMSVNMKDENLNDGLEDAVKINNVQKYEVKKTEEKQITNNNSNQIVTNLVEEDEMDSVTMLRRMRKRK
jgi:ATP-dependent RNA helicase DDX35